MQRRMKRRTSAVALALMLAVTLFQPATAEESAAGGERGRLNQGDPQASRKQRALEAFKKRFDARPPRRVGVIEGDAGYSYFLSKSFTMRGTSMQMLAGSEGLFPVGYLATERVEGSVTEMNMIAFVMHEASTNRAMTRGEITGAANFFPAMLVRQGIEEEEFDSVFGYVGIDLSGKAKKKDVKKKTFEDCTGHRKTVRMTMKGRLLVDTNDDLGRKRFGKLTGKWVKFSNDYDCSGGEVRRSAAEPTAEPTAECAEAARLDFDTESPLLGEGDLSMEWDAEGTEILWSEERNYYLLFHTTILREELGPEAFTYGGDFNPSTLDGGDPNGFSGVLTLTEEDSGSGPGPCEDWITIGKLVGPSGDFTGTARWGMDLTVDSFDGSGNLEHDFENVL